MALVWRALRQPGLLLPWEFSACRALVFGSWGKGAAFSCRIVETGFMARYYPQVETSIEKAEQGPAGGSVRAHSELLNCQWVCDVNTVSFVPKWVFKRYLQLWPLLAIGNCSERLKFRIKRHYKVTLNAGLPGCFCLYWGIYHQPPAPMPSYRTHL